MSKVPRDRHLGIEKELVIKFMDLEAKQLVFWFDLKVRLLSISS